MIRKCHEVDYTILGNDMQLVEVELDPGETVVAEAGVMNYMEDGIEFETHLGDGSAADEGMLSKLFSAGKRMITGESLFMTHFTNRGTKKAVVAFAAPFPGKIIAIDQSKTGEVLCQKDSFLAAALGTNIGIAFQKRLGTGFFGGEVHCRVYALAGLQDRAGWWPEVDDFWGRGNFSRKSPRHRYSLAAKPALLAPGGPGNRTRTPHGRKRSG